MEDKLTEPESLQIISQTIQQTQNNFRKGAGNMTIFWGYLVAFTALLDFLLTCLFNKDIATLAWLLMIPGCVVSYFMEKKAGSPVIVKTPIDSIVGATWFAFVVSIIILIFVFVAISFYYPHVVEHYNMMTSTILLFSATAQFITGKAYRFRPYMNAGFVFWAGAIICLIIISKPLIHSWVLIVCMIFGNIIPGMKLNKKAQENVSGK